MRAERFDAGAAATSVGASGSGPAATSGGLRRALGLVLRAAPSAMARGAALSVAVLVMGAALLGLSGWFVAATGVAGLAGIGIAFDVFRPSAGIRFLALGRAGARYAERLLTHDATLRALAALRADLLRRQLARPWEALLRLRAPLGLTRITADVDALDGVALRLALPVAAGTITQGLAFLALGWLVGWQVAAAVCALFLVGGGALLWRMARRTRAPSVAAERAGQRLRSGAMAMLRGQGDLIVHGRLGAAAARLLADGDEADAATRRLDRAERDAGFGLSVTVAAAAGAALALGYVAVGQGAATAPQAAIAVLVALALAETVLPLRRGLAEIGRIRDSASRVFAPVETELDHPSRGPFDPARGLEARGLSFRRPGAAAPVLSGLDLAVAPGETVALTGPSGAGKSTALALLAGVAAPSAGEVRLQGRPLPHWSEGDLRAVLLLVPQRAALIGGTVRENLLLAGEADDSALWRALDICALAERIEALGGLDGRLGEGGAGLSGGESRRLVLARALLRRPAVLLLDEPTEGLDAPTAARVLAGLRAALPRAAILAASHRPAETAWADRRAVL